MLSTRVASLSNGAYRIVSRAAAVSTARTAHTLPDLPYDFNALEPYISADIMKLHHGKHHQTYVTNLNMTEEKIAEAKATGDVSGVISLQPALKFHGGGHINHSIFWENLSPKGGGQPSGDLMTQIIEDFESFDNFKKAMSTASVGVQGSGWGWLGYNSSSAALQIATCANQDPLQATTGLIPLLGFDVWEHAYYLQYKNLRPDYVKGLWSIVNWNNVTQRFQQAQPK